MTPLVVAPTSPPNFSGLQLRGLNPLALRDLVGHLLPFGSKLLG